MPARRRDRGAASRRQRERMDAAGDQISRWGWTPGFKSPSRLTVARRAMVGLELRRSCLLFWSFTLQRRLFLDSARVRAEVLSNTAHEACSRTPATAVCGVLAPLRLEQLKLALVCLYILARNNSNRESSRAQSSATTSRASKRPSRT